MMMIASPAVGNMFLFLLLVLLSTNASSSSTVSSSNKDQEEAYSKLPPTVFAPDGRLFGVERVAREAMMGPSSMTKGDQIDEDSCCTVFAIRCGGSQCKAAQGQQQQADDAEQIIENSDKVEDDFAVVVGIGPRSPFLHRDMEILEQEKQQLLKQESIEHRDDDDEQDAHDGQQSAFYKPLVLEYNTTQQQQQQSLSSMSSSTTTSRQLPISILSPSLITAVGGTSPIDSTILLRRSIEVALSLYKLDNGGVHFFASHSLESDSNNGGGSDDDGSSSSGINVSGGASGVRIESLVRRIADMAQSSTQNLGGKYGRMLSSSLLAVGNDNNNSLQNDNDDRLCIWRVDPTGQFWKCEASAAGYGTMEVEAELLSRVRAWKKSITMKDDESSTESKTTRRTRTLNRKEVDEDEEMMNDVIISNEDVRMYLASLTEEEAVKVASDCLIDGLLNCNRSAAADVQKVNKNNNEVSFRDWRAYDLRRRIQCVVLRRSCNGGVKVI